MPNEYALHIHFGVDIPLKESKRHLLGTYIFINDDGEIQRTPYVESRVILGTNKYPTLLDMGNILIAGDLPLEWWAQSKQLLQELVGADWVNKILEIGYKADDAETFFTMMQPIASRQENWELLIQLVEQSSQLREKIVAQEWGKRLGVIQRDFEDKEAILLLGYPLVINGDIMRIVNRTEVIAETEEYFSLLRHTNYPEYTLSVINKEGIEIIFDRGFLLVKKGTSFKGHERLLEDAILRGMELSKRLEGKLEELGEVELWPPVNASFSGISADLFQETEVEKAM